MRIGKFSYCIHNNIIEPLLRWIDSHRKTHYECCVCGMLLAPYFEQCKYGSIKHDYGWHKLDNGDWLCHHCAEHGYAPLSDGEPTFEEWQENFVIPRRNLVRKLIKEKDPKYYGCQYFYDEEQ